MEIEFDPVPSLPPGPSGGERTFGSFEPLIRLLAGGVGPDGGAETVSDPRLVVFAADHAVAEAAISAYPPTDTRVRVAALRAGNGGIAVLAEEAGAHVRCVELLTAADGSGPRWRSGRIDVEDALSAEDFAAAVRAGKTAADTAVDEGADLLIGAVCSVGVSTPTAVLTAAVTGMEPVDATSRGSGIGDAAWIRKVAIVRDALYRVRIAGTDAATLLRVGGGADLAALTGFIAQAAVRRTPVLVDDTSSTLASLLAGRVAPGAENYVVATSLTDERSHRRLLDLLGRGPMTAWELRSGGGSGALLLVPVIRAVLRARATTDPGSTTSDAIPDWNPELL